MNDKLRMYAFGNGAMFALAKDIEDYAALKGWKIKVDCDGNRHPGTICNEHIKRLLKSNNLRRHFNWHTLDVISVPVKNIENYPIIADLIENDIINYSTVKQGYLDLYNLNAVRMIISCMIQDVTFNVPEEDIMVDYSYQSCTIEFESHKWNTRKLNTKPLFGIKENSKSTFSFFYYP